MISQTSLEISTISLKREINVEKKVIKSGLNAGELIKSAEKR